MRTWAPFPSLALQPIAPPKVKRSHLQLAYPVALTMLKHHTVCDRTIEVRAEHRTATGQLPVARCWSAVRIDAAYVRATFLRSYVL